VLHYWGYSCLVSRIALDPKQPKLTSEQKADLQFNIQLLRDTIVYFTATASARGVSGHTGQSVSFDRGHELTLLL